MCHIPISGVSFDKLLAILVTNFSITTSCTLSVHLSRAPRPILHTLGQRHARNFHGLGIRLWILAFKKFEELMDSYIFENIWDKRIHFWGQLSELIEYISGSHLRKAQLYFARALDTRVHTIFASSQAQHAPYLLWTSLWGRWGLIKYTVTTQTQHPKIWQSILKLYF